MDDRNIQKDEDFHPDLIDAFSCLIEEGQLIDWIDSVHFLLDVDIIKNMINTTIESSEDSLLHLITQSEQWILPCLLLIGTTCNTLTFLVMRRGRMRYSSSCFYMATLAIADTFVLWIGCLNRWLELLDQQRPILACNLCCKFGTFAFFFFADCR